MASTSVRTEEATDTRPKGACKSMTGSVIDPRSKYPSTIHFAEKNPNAKIKERSSARRPGGALRKGHGFKSVMCTCGGHPCKCTTSEAKKHVIHSNTHV